MKSRTSLCVAAVTVLTLLGIPVGLAAQANHENHMHHHYQLIDLGTFGGPQSFEPVTFYFAFNGTVGTRTISNQGAVAGFADTPTQDPFCYLSNDCFFEDTFRWQNGVLTKLGTLPDGQGSSANWISGNGLIAGFSQNGQIDPLIGFPEAHAALWQGSGITDLGVFPGGNVSLGWAVNNHGQVVGFSTNATSDPYSYYYFEFFSSSGGTQTRAFLWDQQNGMQDLGTLGGPDAWAGLVNEKGQVAGISFTSSAANANNGPCPANVPTQDIFFWERDSGMTDIGNFGGTCSLLYALNNRSQLVGQSYLVGNTIVHALLWRKQGQPQLKDLGTLGGDNAGALWINDAGDAIGYADLPPNPPGCMGLACQHHGFLWKRGVMTDLGSIGSDPCSRALSINARGQIVGGTAAVCGGPLTHGFLWDDGGPAVDLNTLVQPGAGLTLTEPVYINDQGEIAGNGVLSNGDTHAFVLIPCDENHPGLEGCDYSLVQANAVQSAVPAVHDTAGPLPPPALWQRNNRFRFPAFRSHN